MLANFTIIRIHKETETRGICKLSVSTKLYSTTYFTFSHINNKLLQKISKKPVRTRKDC